MRTAPLGTLTFALITVATAQTPTLSEAQARQVLDQLYKGDYRDAFVQKRPELFLRHIPDDFQSVQVDGQTFDAAALRQFFPTQFPNMVRTIEHNVTIEDVDVLPGGTVSAIVTLHTLIEFRGRGGNYLVNTVGTYRDDWQNRGGRWVEVRGHQLRNQTTTAPRP
ncbi:hypothetical protein DAETH_36000 (plasmid) [Deinococcus aetherius]|uniref:DUF4440 domain-containing protein n=1 Tax=Deinococcus aetherius TaxID=200252 RepID=A0ABM8AIM8_9DEIO|nr:nuclear transport factor 2 family protein [Deinococcus aetherius]BDP43631.1 hypothetical protein DAETH_36000 [Deinococcus aetherius]